MPSSPKAQILLVEDNRADVILIREALELHRVECELAVVVNGEIAMNYIDELDDRQHSCPDLVIIDLNLPKRPGWEVLRSIRASVSCRDVPVVVLTSSDNQKDKDSVAPFLPLHYLTKPSTLDDFMDLGGIFKQIVQKPR